MNKFISEQRKYYSFKKQRGLSNFKSPKHAHKLPKVKPEYQANSIGARARIVKVTNA